MFRFTIRELLFLTITVGIIFGWGLDSLGLQARIGQLRAQIQRQETLIADLHLQLIKLQAHEEPSLVLPPVPRATLHPAETDGPRP